MAYNTRHPGISSTARAKFKVKIRSLTEEAKIIRDMVRKNGKRVSKNHRKLLRYQAEIRKLKPGEDLELLAKMRRIRNASFSHSCVNGIVRQHNLDVIRPEARSTQLAYAIVANQSTTRRSCGLLKV